MPVAETWARRGLTLLWGAESLRDLAPAAEVRPLRSLFGDRSGWPEVLPSNGGRALVTAGLEATLDCLSPADAEQWLERDLRDLIMAFQSAYQGDCALVLWLPSGRDRIRYDAPNDAWLWATPGDTPLSLGRLLFSGAEHEVERLWPPGLRGLKDETTIIGLHHARLS